MNAYLTRLGIRREIQQWLTPYYHTDESGNVCFSYGIDTEVYGLAFHKVPSTPECWIAGPENPASIREVVICSSAMEAISWLNCNFNVLRFLDNVMFIATGSSLTDCRLNVIRGSLQGRKYNLIYGNDLLGRICDLKVAAILAGHPAEIAVLDDVVHITFRYANFQMPCETFSLNAFERVCRYRFSVKTLKPHGHATWLALLGQESFNH